MATCLASVSYYRLSAYWHPFRAEGSNKFVDGTCFDRVWESYAFDRQLRLLAMDAIERIEIAIRTQIVYHHARLFGPFGYATNPSSLPELVGDRRARFFSSLDDEIARSRETFVKHYKQKYREERYLPLWMSTELMSFGSILTLFNGCSEGIRRAVSRPFEIEPEVLSSWLLALNTVRNVCAHHGRLWNRELGTTPKIPRERKHPEWHKPYRLEAGRVFSILTISNYCLRHISPSTGWAKRWRALLEAFPRIHRRSLGVPPNWLVSSLWEEATSSEVRRSSEAVGTYLEIPLADSNNNPQLRNNN